MDTEKAVDEAQGIEDVRRVHYMSSIGVGISNPASVITVPIRVIDDGEMKYSFGLYERYELPAWLGVFVGVACVLLSALPVFVVIFGIIWLLWPHSRGIGGPLGLVGGVVIFILSVTMYDWAKDRIERTVNRRKHKTR